MAAELVRITPSMARDMLAQNLANRPLSEGLVLKYAQAIRDDAWAINGETIKFAADGALLDGQHRLSAVIKADRPISSMVVRGVKDRAAFATIDAGKGRTIGDVLALDGVDHANALASMAGFVLAVQMDLLASAGSTGRSPPRHTVIEFVRSNHAALSSSRQYCHKAGCAKVIGLSIAAGTHFLFTEHSAVANAPDLANEFFGELGSGVYSDFVPSKQHPVYLLRERFIAARFGGTKFTRVIQTALIFKAWNSYARRAPLGVLRYRVDDEFPAFI